MVKDLPEEMYSALIRAYMRCSSGNFLEDEIVKYADLLESAMYCLCERELGNTNMDKIITKMITWLDEYGNELMEALTDEYKRCVSCET